MPWHTHGWFLAMFCACVFVWTHRFYIAIYTIFFSHRARCPCCQWSGRVEGWFTKCSIAPTRLFLWETNEWMTFRQRKKFQTMFICVKRFNWAFPCLIFVTHLWAEQYVVTKRKSQEILLKTVWSVCTGFAECMHHLKSCQVRMHIRLWTRV